MIDSGRLRLREPCDSLRRIERKLLAVDVQRGGKLRTRQVEPSNNQVDSVEFAGVAEVCSRMESTHRAVTVDAADRPLPELNAFVGERCRTHHLRRRARAPLAILQEKQSDGLRAMLRPGGAEEGHAFGNDRIGNLRSEPLCGILHLR